MHRHHRKTILTIGTFFLLVSGNLLYAEQPKAAADPGRAQAIESVKKNLERDPKNAGLQNALQCLEGGQCNDRHKLDQAIGSVKNDLKKHPDDQGMHHALDDLQHHHQDLEHHSTDHGQMDHDRPMPHDSTPHDSAPHSSDMPGSPHR